MQGVLERWLGKQLLHPMYAMQKMAGRGDQSRGWGGEEGEG